jgi:hypothetical protein
LSLDPAHNSYGLSVTFGGPIVPLYFDSGGGAPSPLGGAIGNAEHSAESMLGGAPGVLSSPGTLPSYIGAHGTDITRIREGANAVTPITDLPSRPVRPNVRGALDATYGPSAIPGLQQVQEYRVFVRAQVAF